MITVVIPAFNAEPYLANCLRSLEAADEVIVVDDGSTDGTGQLVRQAFPSVRLIRQENRGVSSARNTGIAAAAGDYLVFVDADDTVFPQGLEQLRQAVDRQEADIVVMRSFCGKEERYPWQGRFPEGEPVTGETIGRVGYVRGSVCGCAFRRSYLMENALRFDERLAMAEDTVFFAHALSAGGRVLFRDIVFYSVDARPGSASRSYDPVLLQRFGLALDSALGIPDPLLRTRTCLSIIHGVTDAGIRMGLSPKQVKRQVPIGQARLLPSEGLGRDRISLALIRFAYPLFFRLKQAKQLLRK